MAPNWAVFVIESQGVMRIPSVGTNTLCNPIAGARLTLAPSLILSKEPIFGVKSGPNFSSIYRKMRPFINISATQ